MSKETEYLEWIKGEWPKDPAQKIQAVHNTAINC